MNSINTLPANLPPITLTADDARRLSFVANAGLARLPQAAAFLAREVDRADIVPLTQIRHELVRMGSRVTYRDDTSGQRRTLTLVYPDEANIDLNRVSVLTPVGAALVGLSVGQSIEWETPAGDPRSLTVLEVSSEPEPQPDGPLAA